MTRTIGTTFCFLTLRSPYIKFEFNWPDKLIEIRFACLKIFFKNMDGTKLKGQRSTLTFCMTFEDDWMETPYIVLELWVNPRVLLSSPIQS